MNERAQKVMQAMLSIQRYPWEQGVAAQAMFEAGETNTWVCMAHDAILRQQSDGRLAVINSNIAVTDPAANGEVCLRAFELTGDSFYKDGADRMLEYLKTLAPRTPDGVIYHNTVTFDPHFTPCQLWVDSAYMAPPFLAVMGETKDAVAQIKGLFRYLRDPETGVLFHNYDVGSGKFVRKLRWATGNGWALMGIARVVDELKKRGETEEADALIALGNVLLDSLIPYLRADGRLNDIMDDDNSFADCTSSLMMSVYIYRGILGGWLKKDYLKYAEKAYKTACEKVDRFGILHEVCGCPNFDKEGTSCEAQASFIMADAWRNRVLGM